MIRRAARSVVVVVACWFFVNGVEDLARYLRMREMSSSAGGVTSPPHPR